jgi:hypothetical protein
VPHKNVDVMKETIKINQYNVFGGHTKPKVIDEEKVDVETNLAKSKFTSLR